MAYRYILVFLLTANTAWSQSFVTRVSSKTMGKKDLLEVQYIAENLELSDFILPRFSSWSVQSGPEFRSNRVSVNGVVKQQIIYSLLLQPMRTGKLSVPSATVVIDKHTSRRSNTITIDVKPADHVAGNIQGVTTSRAQIADPAVDDFTKDQLIRRGENPAAKVKGNLLIRLDVNKQSSFVGEPILATYRLYTRLRSQSRVTKQPTFSGATVVEMTPEESVPKQERLNGKMYNVYVVRKVQLFPLQPGRLVLPQASVENKVTFYKADNVNYRDLYYNPSNLPVEEQTVTITSSASSVDVKPLPANAPASFGGAVGKFRVEVGKAGDKPVTTNNTAAFVFVVEGPGNLQQIKAPEVMWPKGIEAFEPTDEEEVDKSGFPARVRKTFKYPFLITKTGSYTVPPVEFSYFDPYTAQYVTLRSKPYSFKVGQGEKISVSDFDFKEKFGFETHLAIILGGGLLAIFVGLLLYSRRKKTKPLVAPAVAPAQVYVQPEVTALDTEQFIHYIRHSNPMEEGPAFYKNLQRHITSYLKAKFNISPDEIDAFAQSRPDASILGKIKTLLSQCNLAMYTPLYNVEEAMTHRIDAIKLLSNLEGVD
ncbi:MAG TPA: BatD family protein [Segetibacter sp.]